MFRVKERALLWPILGGLTGTLRTLRWISTGHVEMHSGR